MQNQFDLNNLFRGVKFLSFSELNKIEDAILSYDKNILYHDKNNTDYRNIISKTIISVIENETQKKTSEEERKFIPFVTLNSISFSDSKNIDLLLSERLYTHNFAYAKINIKIDKFISFEELYHKLYR